MTTRPLGARFWWQRFHEMPFGEFLNTWSNTTAAKYDCIAGTHTVKYRGDDDRLRCWCDGTIDNRLFPT